MREKFVSDIPTDACDELVTLAGNCTISGWDFPDWHNAGFTDSGLLKSPNLRRFTRQVEKRLRSKGFAIVSIARIIRTYPEAVAAAATILLAGLGKPLRVFRKYPHWRPLKADLNRPPEKSGGIGSGPLHMDFVNVENPPDIVCMVCLRADPLGGGESLISRIDGIERLLGTTEIEILSRSQFRDGEVIELDSVGGDANPFPVLSLQSEWKYRFTESLVKSNSDVQTQVVLEKISTLLHSSAVAIDLICGDVLILDQHQVTHARSALGKGQETIPDDKRRLLFLSYVKRESLTAV